MASRVATLPSYTVLPIRVTTPPMIDASTFVVMVTVRPVALARRCCSCAARSGGSGAAVVTSALQHVPMLHQPFTVDVEEIRQQRQPTPRGEQQHEFADRCRRLQALEDLLHDGALVSRRHDRIRERSLQIAVRANQIDKRRELLFGALGIRLFVGYVEQRSRVSRCGGPHAHDVECASLTR